MTLQASTTDGRIDVHGLFADPLFHDFVEQELLPALGMTEVIVRADTALYRSKRDGRNRVELESSQILEARNGTLQAASA